MALPYSREQTYIDGTSQIAAGELNEGIQDAIVRLNESAHRKDVAIYDEFLGADFSDLWTVSGSLGTPNCGADDSAADGFGAAELVQIAGTDTQYIRGTLRLPLPTRSWTFAARVRVLSWNGGQIEVGITPGGGSHWCGFKATTASATWKVADDHHGGSTTTAASAGTSYQLLEMRYDFASGILTFYVDGSEVHSQAAAGFGATTFSLHFYGSCTAAMALYCDFIKLWVDR
jgi:hypothetical protein